MLVYAVFRGKEWRRDTLAGCWWPIALCVLYTSIVVLFSGQEEGGFDSLAQVKRLFASDWALLAGWVHYLAFDLFIGAWIAREATAKGMSRWWLVPLLPATFLFGPLAFGMAPVLENAVLSPNHYGSATNVGSVASPQQQEPVCVGGVVGMTLLSVLVAAYAIGVYGIGMGRET